MRVWRADLHVHTCLSPCADLSMAPRTIVAAALARGLDAIGVADHNSAANIPAVVGAARQTRLTVLPALEITSREEVHILAIFGDLDAARAMQQVVYQRLPGQNQPEIFGLQVLVNEDHDVLGFEPRLLAGATEMSVNEIVERVHALDGLAIAAHADREAFGLLGHLGFLPPDLALDAVELSPHMPAAEFRRRWPECAAMALVRSSDAHRPEQVGACTTSFRLQRICVDELRQALAHREGRCVVNEEEGGPTEPWRN